MSDDDLHIETQRIGTASEDGLDISDLSASEACAELFHRVMRNLNTKPGPDEEVVFQVVRRRRAPDAPHALREVREMPVVRDPREPRSERDER